MLNRPSFWILLLMGFGWSVYQVKYEVQQKESALAQMNRDIARTEADIRILRAEWSLVTDPARLEQQNASLLGLVPLRPQQFIAGWEPFPIASPRLAGVAPVTPKVTPVAPKLAPVAARLDRQSLHQMTEASPQLGAKGGMP